MMGFATGRKNGPVEAFEKNDPYQGIASAMP
jgi:hypothetical protein